MRQVGCQLDVFFKQAREILGFDVNPRDGFCGSEWFYYGLVKRGFFRKLNSLCTLYTFDKYADVPVGLLQTLYDHRDRSHTVNLGGLGIIDFSVALGGEKQAFTRFHGSFQGGHRPSTAYHERHHHPGKDNYIPQWQQR